MAQQVKFYSTSASDYAAQVAANSVNGGGVYFVGNGELYKGTQRFGANKVWTTKPSENAGVIGGDMYISGGVAEVFNGSTWVGIANANKWTVASFGGEGSYITGISQSADGTVTATAAAFPALDTGNNDGEVKLGSDAAKVSGWDTLVGSVSTNASNIASVSSALGSLSTTAASLSTRVGTLETKVSGIESIVDVSQSLVSAATGSFTNLTVTSTATFSATTVSASTLTVGGSTIGSLISQGADARIDEAKLNGNISSSTGTGLVNEGQVVNYVSAKLQSFDNAMHYIGTTSDSSIAQGATECPSDISGYTSDVMKSGDIIIMGTQEYIFNGTQWELIGDQGTYATKGELSELSASLTLLSQSLGTAAFKNYAETVTAGATTLPTGGAVASYVAGVIDGLAGSASDSDKGIAVEVVTADGQVSSVDVGVTLDTDIGPSTGTGAATDNEIPSSLAVRRAIESAISDATLVWLSANGTVLA